MELNRITSGSVSRDRDTLEQENEIAGLKNRLRELENLLRQEKPSSDSERNSREDVQRTISRNRDLENQLKKLKGELARFAKENDDLKRDLKLKDDVDQLREKEKGKLLESVRASSEGEGKREAGLAKDLEEKNKELKSQEK